MTNTREARKIKVYSFTSVFVQAIVSRNEKQKRTDEGSMLVEVLVALLVLAIVFTSAVLALSDMGSKRVAIEQRDRAIRLITEYEERSRIFRCGLIVDRLNNSSEAIAQFEQEVQACDFLTNSNNAGDIVDLEVLDNNGRLAFTINIRYWWEVPGSDIHSETCSQIANIHHDGILPSIYVRAIHIAWEEKGSEVTETLIKKSPVPVDNAIFAVGNRTSLLVNASSSDARLSFGNHGVYRINDGLFPGQPDECIWFPYIAPNSDPHINGSSRATNVPTDAGGLAVINP